MSDRIATNPDFGASPLVLAVVTDAVQRMEAAGPLDDAAALRQAFAARSARADQVQLRAWLLGERLGLPAELTRWRRLGWGVVWLLALLMAFTGLGLARAVLGEGRSINAVAAFVSLLGLHLATLLIWLAGTVLAGRRWAGPLLGRAAVALTARLPLERGPHALTLLQSFIAVLRRQGLLSWLTGAVSHGIWTLAFLITLAVLAFGFAFHAYTLTWETTILSTSFFQRFVQLTGTLPALLGLAVPDVAAVQGAAGAAAGSPDSQSAWAWWLMGCVLVYGLLPRALLAALSLWRWRSGQRRLAGQVDMADPDVRRIVSRLDALEPPQVIDPEQRPAAGRPAARRHPLAAPGAPGSLVVLGFELPPEQPWPVAGLPSGDRAPQRIAGSASEREAVLSELAQTRPESLLLVVSASASPDRGTARFLREAAPLAARCALFLQGADAAPGAAVARWRQWLDSEGFSALIHMQQQQYAINWIANRSTVSERPSA